MLFVPSNRVAHLLLHLLLPAHLDASQVGRRHVVHHIFNLHVLVASVFLPRSHGQFFCRLELLLFDLAEAIGPLMPMVPLRLIFYIRIVFYVYALRYFFLPPSVVVRDSNVMQVHRAEGLAIGQLLQLLERVVQRLIAPTHRLVAYEAVADDPVLRRGLDD